MIKIRYNKITTLVNGHFPDDVYYPNNTINQDSKTITNLEGTFPFIEIEDSEQVNFKQMCVINGVYQEYILPLDIQLQEAKTSKIAQLNQNRNDFCLIPIEYNGNNYATTLEAKNAINFYIASLSTLATSGDYYTAEGGKISLTKADFKALATLIQTREIESRDKREDLLTQINACTTLEEVNAININF